MGGVAFSKPRPLADGDSLEGFHCGLEFVDGWLSTRAKGARVAGSAVVYVSFAGDKLAGFYTLSSQSISRGGTRGWLSRNAPEQIPVILLGMLGVDQSFQGQGLGRNLLLDAAKRAIAVSGEIGAKALVVDPADDKARKLYESCGFRGIPGSKRMFAKLVS